MSKFEVGMEYKNRGGETVLITEIGSDNHAYPISGYVKRGTSELWTYSTYSPDGYYLTDTPNDDRSLVAPKAPFVLSASVIEKAERVYEESREDTYRGDRVAAYTAAVAAYILEVETA